MIQEAYDKSQREIEELKSQLLTAKNETEKKKIEAKITYAERWLQINGWVEKGNEYSLKKEYDNAIENYNKAIAFNPDDADVYTQRGKAYYDKGQYDKAIEDFNRAIALNPNDENAYAMRGFAYIHKGQYDKGNEDTGKSIALQDSFGSSFFNRRIEKYNQLIALNPKDAKTYVGRGNAYRGKGQYDMAIEDFNKAIALNPKDAEAYSGRGVAYFFGAVSPALSGNTLSGNMGRAISDFQKACDLGLQKGCENLQGALKER
ncbi:MAG: tetratricopeptide repeat protein [Nitrospirae bacterium]|nr:tetratricopeptide repeat protein [Nitrospirota bacterium]